MSVISSSNKTNTKHKSICQKIVVSALVSPFVCLFLSIHIAGCFCGWQGPNLSSYQMHQMQREAKKQAYRSLKETDTNKDILQIIGVRIEEAAFKRWIGSGFIVQHNNQQYLVSATHVIMVGSHFQLFKRGELQPFMIDEYVFQSDSSLIRLKDNSFSFPFEVDMEFFNGLQDRLDAKERIECSAYGYTNNGLRKTDGYILDTYVDDNGVVYIVSSNPIVQGMSGGVLTDSEGRAIGVISAYVNGPENWGMYLPISNLIQFIETTKRKASDK